MGETAEHIFSEDLNISTYDLLIKKGEDEEKVLDFGRFCRKYKLAEQASQQPVTTFNFFDESAEQAEAYAKIYDLTEALQMYVDQPKNTIQIIDSWSENEAWEPITNSLGISPVEVWNLISTAQIDIVLEGQQRPDAPEGVLASQSFIIVNDKMEFQPVIINDERTCWKFRSGFFFGQKRLINKAAPKCLWELLDEKMNITKTLKVSIAT